MTAPASAKGGPVWDKYRQEIRESPENQKVAADFPGIFLFSQKKMEEMERVRRTLK